MSQPDRIQRADAIEIDYCTAWSYSSLQVDMVGRCEIWPLPETGKVGTAYHCLAR